MQGEAHTGGFHGTPSMPTRSEVAVSHFAEETREEAWGDFVTCLRAQLVRGRARVGTELKLEHASLFRCVRH